MADDEVFSGFPTCLDDGFTPFPNPWFEILMHIDNIAEFKVVFYVARHTWGYQKNGEREKIKKITHDEFANGRKRQDGSRIDNGTELGLTAVKDGLRKAVEHGYLIFTSDYSDLGRVKKCYGLRLKEENLDGRNPTVSDSRNPTMNGRNPTPQETDSDHPTEKQTDQTNQKRETGKNNVALNAQPPALINKTLQYIKKKEGLTLLQLEQYLHRYMDTTGKEALPLTRKNVVAWTQVSDEFVQFVLKLNDTGHIRLSTCDENLYPKNKKRPQLPVAQNGVEYDISHWEPLIIKYKEKEF